MAMQMLMSDPVEAFFDDSLLPSSAEALAAKEEAALRLLEEAGIDDDELSLLDVLAGLLLPELRMDVEAFREGSGLGLDDLFSDDEIEEIDAALTVRISELPE
jgi:hypothetical protein